MNKTQFKLLYRWFRMIRAAQYVGTYGHISDIVTEFNVSWEFMDKIYLMRKKPEKIIKGKYSKDYIDAQNQAAAWDSYHERIIGA